MVARPVGESVVGHQGGSLEGRRQRQRRKGRCMNAVLIDARVCFGKRRVGIE